MEAIGGPCVLISTTNFTSVWLNCWRTDDEGWGHLLDAEYTEMVSMESVCNKSHMAICREREERETNRRKREMSRLICFKN